jgi:hypothetical protein
MKTCRESGIGDPRYRVEMPLLLASAHERVGSAVVSIHLAVPGIAVIAFCILFIVWLACMFTKKAKKALRDLQYFPRFLGAVRGVFGITVLQYIHYWAASTKSNRVVFLSEHLLQLIPIRSAL